MAYLLKAKRHRQYPNANYAIGQIHGVPNRHPAHHLLAIGSRVRRTK